MYLFDVFSTFILHRLFRSDHVSQNAINDRSN